MLQLGTTQLGLTWTDVSGAAQLGARILLDPYLPQAITLVTQIADEATGPSGSDPGSPGVGIQDLIFPMKAVLFVQRNPWAPWVGGLVVLAVPFLLGMATARLVWK
jgi:hypothetical protein